MDDVLSIQQVANWLRISHPTAWRLRAELGARQEGRLLLVDAANVRAYLRRNERPQPTTEEPDMLPTDVATDGLSELKLYRLGEVAELTQIPESSLLRDCRAEKIRHVHSGKQRLMKAAHIRELIASREKGGDGPQQDPAVAAVIDRLSKRGTSTKRSPAKRAAA